MEPRLLTMAMPLPGLCCPRTSPVSSRRRSPRGFPMGLRSSRPWDSGCLPWPKHAGAGALADCTGVPPRCCWPEAGRAGRGGGISGAVSAGSRALLKHQHSRLHHGCRLLVHAVFLEYHRAETVAPYRQIPHAGQIYVVLFHPLHLLLSLREW